MLAFQMLHDFCLENTYISAKTIKYTAIVSMWFMHVSLSNDIIIM